ncbi:hypothetical protein HN011_002129 [Eciton burchellii]|nr:hypothetical protein HN011_002129 [Eciton burchellii]
MILSGIILYSGSDSPLVSPVLHCVTFIEHDCDAAIWSSKHSASSTVFTDFTQRALAQCSDNPHRNSRVSSSNSRSDFTRPSTRTVGPRVKKSRESSADRQEQSSVLWILTAQNR